MLPQPVDGMCVPMDAKPGKWWVGGRTEWYECDPASGRCNCADHLYRHRKLEVMTQCRHLRALTGYLALAGMLNTPLEPERVSSGEWLPSQDELRRMFA